MENAIPIPWAFGTITMKLNLESTPFLNMEPLLHARSWYGPPPICCLRVNRDEVVSEW